jgi:hypothetical protein
MSSESDSHNRELSQYWKKVDLKKEEIPLDKIESVSRIHIPSKEILIEVKYQTFIFDIEFIV